MKGPSKITLDHPINRIAGWTPWHYIVDWLHTVDLGVASHACANILFNIIYDKLSHMPRATAMEMVLSRLLVYPSEHGSGFDRLELSNITDPGRPHRVFPFIHHMKAAQVRHMVPKVAASSRICNPFSL